MISLCDGCGCIFITNLKTINAKVWNPRLCDIPVEESEVCSVIRCRYNIEGECCIEFQFCDDCLSDRSILDNRFKNVTP
jgi:hypothetical protein